MGNPGFGIPAASRCSGCICASKIHDCQGRWMAAFGRGVSRSDCYCPEAWAVSLAFREPFKRADCDKGRTLRPW
ncbi:hypothetical protein G6F46_015623 [Rhizopus delemar]|nr:hypothetical protein G6F23_014639 [Rhizopus arrhizus]KAG0735876.1 hypothetical protein G6F24_018565 [Rhizopus arrhizus]KAG1272173.1 hypothetical protein G6F65_011891 [Rhizopus arrhizus]KAG1386978.1 hypothetical protein G6F59_016608 [Rhizopus arrhizus]KAG1579689.1 hypothetical protein G6F46_015623 [Rhizopus delemar]